MNNANVLVLWNTVDADMNSTTDFAVKSLPVDCLEPNKGVTRTEDAIYILSISRRFDGTGKFRQKDIGYWVSPSVYREGYYTPDCVKGREDIFLGCLAQCTPFGDI